MNTLEKILEEIEEKIKFAEKIIVKPPCDKLDEIANDTAEAFIEAYKECVEIIRSYMDDHPDTNVGDKDDTEEKIREHIAECIHRIDNIRSFIGRKECSDDEKCRKNIVVLKKSIFAMEEYLRLKKRNENDGWTPVSEELPPFGEKLQATILHHEWIADYDSSWVPEEERTYHQEYTEVCEIYPMGGMWFYACKEDEYQRDIAYIKPKKDLGNPISEIIAWRPLPEPYKGGK